MLGLTEKEKRNVYIIISAGVIGGLLSATLWAIVRHRVEGWIDQIRAGGGGEASQPLPCNMPSNYRPYDPQCTIPPGFEDGQLIN